MAVPPSRPHTRTSRAAAPQTAKELANAVIPNEYGIDPSGKLRIGSKICSSLLGKILADLANMRDESLATANIPVRAGGWGARLQGAATPRGLGGGGACTPSPCTGRGGRDLLSVQGASEAGPGLLQREVVQDPQAAVR